MRHALTDSLPYARASKPRLLYCTPMTYHDLLRRLEDTPFKPFRIRMENNTVYDVFDPGMVIVARNSAFVVTQSERDKHGRRVATDWRTISIDHILEFSDIDEKEIRRRKRA